MTPEEIQQDRLFGPLQRGQQVDKLVKVSLLKLHQSTWDFKELLLVRSEEDVSWLGAAGRGEGGRGHSVARQHLPLLRAPVL